MKDNIEQLLDYYSSKLDNLSESINKYSEEERACFQAYKSTTEGTLKEVLSMLNTLKSLYEQKH